MHIYNKYIYICIHTYVCIAYISFHSKDYEAPSFHTSGTPRNIPYTILTRSHMGEKYVQEEFLGEEFLGEKYV